MDITPNPATEQAGDTGLARFTRKLLITVLVLALALAAWRLVDLGILFFGAALIAIGLRRAAESVGRRARIWHGGRARSGRAVVRGGADSVSYIFWCCRRRTIWRACQAGSTRLAHCSHLAGGAALWSLCLDAGARDRAGRTHQHGRSGGGAWDAGRCAYIRLCRPDLSGRHLSRGPAASLPPSMPAAGAAGPSRRGWPRAGPDREVLSALAAWADRRDAYHWHALGAWPLGAGHRSAVRARTWLAAC